MSNMYQKKSLMLSFMWILKTVIILPIPQAVSWTQLANILVNSEFS